MRSAFTKFIIVQLLLLAIAASSGAAYAHLKSFERVADRLMHENGLDCYHTEIVSLHAHASYRRIFSTLSWLSVAVFILACGGYAI